MPKYIDVEKLQLEPIDGVMNGVLMLGNGRAFGKTVRMISEALKSMIDNAPAEDVAPVVHGRWVLCEDDGYEWYECSVCRAEPLNDNNERPVLSDYCPNCGAKMDGEETAGGTDEKIVWAISTIERALGVIEGVSDGAKIKYADYLLGAVTMIDKAVKVINSREDCPETSIKGRAIWVTAHNCAISCLTACDAVSAIMPPVKMGQVLWCTIPCSDVPLECKVYCICQEEREGLVLEYFRCVVKGYFGKAFSFEDVGKTIFLTKEEAIAALGGVLEESGNRDNRVPNGVGRGCGADDK